MLAESGTPSIHRQELEVTSRTHKGNWVLMVGMGLLTESTASSASVQPASTFVPFSISGH